MRETRLLPEAGWKHCARCKRAVPEFEFSETLETKLDGLLKEGKGPSAAALVVRQTGCDLRLAEAWAVHRLETGEPEQALPPCPWCGQTSQVEQNQAMSFLWRGLSRSWTPKAKEQKARRKMPQKGLEAARILPRMIHQTQGNAPYLLPPPRPAASILVG